MTWGTIAEYKAQRVSRRLGRYVLAYHSSAITYDATLPRAERFQFQDTRGEWQGRATRHKAAQALALELNLTAAHAAKMKSWQG